MVKGTVRVLAAKGIDKAVPGCQAQATPGRRNGGAEVESEVEPGTGGEVEAEEVAERLACEMVRGSGRAVWDARARDVL